jgi:hypothetical protein
MGPLVPALAAVGGGSAVAGGITLATAAVGIYSAVEQAKAGSEARREAKREAIREGDAAREEAISRRRELQRGLAMRVAEAGAGGVGTGGSIGALARTDIRDNRNDLAISSNNLSERQRALRGQGKSAQRMGNLRAGASLLDTGKGLYNAMPRKPN